MNRLSVGALVLGLAHCSREPPRRYEGPPPSSASASATPSVSAVASAAAPLIPEVYDLPSDLAARTLAARARFGQTVHTRVVEAFLLVDPASPPVLLDHAAALLARALPPLLDGRFATRPTRAVTVVLFPTHDSFARSVREHRAATGNAVREVTELGIYRRDDREIDADVSGGDGYLPTVVHEVVHVLAQADFPYMPLWLEEGLASLYEAPVFPEDGGIRGLAKNRRHPRLLAALASPKEKAEVNLVALFAMGEETFEARGANGGIDASAWLLHYAMAREFVAWMDERGKLWPFYRAWRRGVSGDVTGEKAFRETTGVAVEEANAEWLRWVRE